MFFCQVDSLKECVVLFYIYFIICEDNALLISFFFLFSFISSFPFSDSCPLLSHGLDIPRFEFASGSGEGEGDLTRCPIVLAGGRAVELGLLRTEASALGRWPPGEAPWLWGQEKGRTTDPLLSVVNVVNAGGY